MSIDRTQPLSPVNSVRPRENNENMPKINPSATGKKPGSDTLVKLSNAQAELMQSDSQDINIARVEMLKEAIRTGQLVMNIGGVADALLTETADYLAEKK